MTPRSSKKLNEIKSNMMTWHVIPHHSNLGLHISMSKKLIKIYLMQHATIQNK
jgi:hypothetical protein